MKDWPVFNDKGGSIAQNAGFAEEQRVAPALLPLTHLRTHPGAGMNVSIVLPLVGGSASMTS
jgi:hypothetical protein